MHDFKGKRLVLYFYPKGGTTGCTIEAQNFQRDLPKYEQKRAVIVGVSVDSTGSHKEFCAKQGLTFKLLADTENTVSSKYGSLTNMLVYRMSSRNTFLIKVEGKIAKVSTGVSPASHSAQVLAALSQLCASKATVIPRTCSSQGIGPEWGLSLDSITCTGSFVAFGNRPGVAVHLVSITHLAKLAQGKEEAARQHEECEDSEGENAGVLH